jgi:dethiobiotin synthetase
MKCFFITASGTETGKTFVTTLLIRQLRAMGKSVRALKPLISGITDANVQDSDSALLLNAMGMPVNETNLAAVSPWRFKAPLAPSMAARLEGRGIDLRDVTAVCNTAMNGPEEFLLIEGVGGVMVPLNETCTVLDWIKALEIPVLLITGSYLGSISHALTALEVLRHADVTAAGIVVSESIDGGAPLADTVAEIAHFSGGVRVLALPRQSGRERAPDLTHLVYTAS